jgi:hypothetical protein
MDALRTYPQHDYILCVPRLVRLCLNFVDKPTEEIISLIFREGEEVALYGKL